MMKKFFLVLLFLFGICSMFFLKYDILASTNNYYVNKVNQANIINTNDLFNIKNNQTIIESGKTAKFTLHLHVSGNDIVYKNVHIEININNQSDDFYFDNNLNDYAISGIKPKLNKNKHLLIYDIKELKAGINYNLVYKVNSQSGLIDDGEELKINASFKADNLINDNNKSSKIVSNALVKYSANGKISLTNKFTSVLGTNLIAPNPKTDIYWDFSVTIPYNGYGDKFIEEYEPIIITYEVDANIPIVNIKELNNQPFRGIKNKDKDSGKNIFTIKIVPPSYEKQRELSKNGYLLNYNFRIHGFVSEKTPEFSWLTNDLKADIKFINDNQPITKSLQAKVMCMSQTLGNHHSDGNLNSIYSIGPYNDKGYLGSWKNQDIKVHDNALLAFGLGLTVGPANDNEVGPQYYSLYYHIDDNLNLEKWYSGDFYYSPDSTNFHWKKQIPLNYPLRYDLYVKYGTSNNLDKEWTLLLKNVKPKTLYHNLNKGKHIGEFRLVVERNGKEREYYDHSEWNDEKQDWDLIYKKVKAVPAGFFSNSVIGYYTVNKGYIGKVSNSISNVIIVNGYGANGLLSNYCTGVNKDNYLDLPKEEKIYKNCNIDEKSNQLLSDSEDWTDVWKKYWGPQTANIVSKEIGEDKVVTTNVSFSYSNGNLIDDESNMVYVNIVNDSASNSNIKGPFTSYVLLPQGVKYSPKQNEYNEFKTSLVDDNYHNKKQSLVKIEWYSTSLVINKKLEALFNVNFDKNVASDITLKVFSFIDSQDYTIPQLENNPLLTDTIKIDDSDDINNNGDSKESLISSGNNYVINKNSIIDIKQVVKGNLDQKYTSLAYTNPNNLVNVELQLSNKTDKNISKLVLIDSLPNKNNHSLVSNKLLNSNYNLMLNGPIKVDKEWLNKVNIKYSTAINPSKVNILDKYTNYQVNSTKLSDINCDKTVWLNEDEVKDWSKIHSFKLEINNDIDFISGASHKISFNLKVLDTVNYQKTLFDDKLPLKQRVAYNTFALSANYSQVIEPQTSAIVLSNSTNNKINKENNNDLEEDGVKCINCKIVDSGNNNLFFGLSIITMMLILSGGYSLKKK